MMSQLSILILASALGQVPAESDLLNSVPPDADIVIRVRGVASVKDHLAVMLKAMSPALAGSAEPVLEQEIAKARAQAGEQILNEPFLVLIRGVTSKETPSTPFALVVKSSDYEAVLKSVADKKDSVIRRSDASCDSFKGPSGQTWYAARGNGTVAFGSDKILIEAFGKPVGRSLGSTIAPGLRSKFLAGDIGMYVNVNSLDDRYSGPIANAKQSLSGTSDQIFAPMGKGMSGVIKSISGTLFEWLKEADAVVLSFEFGGEGLGLSGVLKVKNGSKAVELIARTRTSDAARLGKLPTESIFYAYMNMDEKSFRSLQILTMQMVSPDGKASAEIEAAVAKEHGQIEVFGSGSMTDGMRSLQIINLSDSKSYREEVQASMKLAQTAGNPMNFYKDMKTTPNAETCRGFSFTRIDMTIDYDKYAKLQPTNPSAVASLRAIYGGDTFTTWLGVGEKQVIQVIAPSWADARSRIDGYFAGNNEIGATNGFRATRAKLSKEASLLILVSAQGFVRQLTAQFSMVFPHTSKQAPADLPRNPALIGFSLSPVAPDAFEFQMFVPKAVGLVVEKGLVPALTNLRPPIKP